MENNEYKIFRGTNEFIGSDAGGQIIVSNLLSKRYDEPTYMTFRVIFGGGSSRFSGATLLNTDYDKMPHPLFINSVVDATRSNGANGRSVVEFNRDLYSTRDFLRDSNEFTRAEMLNEFITRWEDLQNNFQWYFQSIEGLSDILTVVPERGKRVGQDARLTFNMIEGLDQRISYLLNLYRKIAWDDTYQRWVLPDMMRFFDIQIYITEFRTFHKSTVNPNSGNPVYLDILNGILPTYLIECQMCEFDINSFDFSYRNKLSIVDNPEQTTVSFKVKVGNVNEISTYPLFYHFIMNDYTLNGHNRSKEKGSMKDLSGRITNETIKIGETETIKESDYVSTRDGDPRYMNMDSVAQNTFFDEGHVSGTPYNQATNKQTLFGATGESDVEVDPTDPATWVGNAITFGKSFTVNFVTQKIDKAKMTKIPGLGFSFNDAVAAIQSKNFVSVLALIRRAIAESIGGAEPTSALLNKKIDATFREFLVGVSQSEATDGDQLELANMAISVLNDRGKWEEVKDLSYATNLKGPGENNIPVNIEGGSQYKQMIAIATNNDRSKATDLDGDTALQITRNLAGINTPSQATVKKDLEGKKYVNPTDRSKSTDLDGGPSFYKTGTIIEAVPSSSLSKKLDLNNIQKISSISTATTSKLATGGSIQGDGGLGNSINDDLDQPKPSDKLGNKIDK